MTVPPTAPPAVLRTVPPPTSSAEPAASSAFELLDPHVRRWVYDSAWTTLRDAQEAAIPLILPGELDVLVSAATAGGKTEAAFLAL